MQWLLENASETQADRFAWTSVVDTGHQLAHEYDQWVCSLLNCLVLLYMNLKHIYKNLLSTHSIYIILYFPEWLVAEHSCSAKLYHLLRRRKKIKKKINSFLVKTFSPVLDNFPGPQFSYLYNGDEWSMQNKQHSVSRIFSSECVTGESSIRESYFSFCSLLVRVSRLTLSNKTKFLA